MSRKIRVLLGGYVNNINAQDLNCRSLAMYLDKDKFDVSAFLVPQEFRDFDIGEEMNGIKLIQLNRPAKILWYWIYLKGILWCDIAYLPKGQKRHWCQFLCKLLRKKSFITVEGVVDKESLQGSIARYGSAENVKNMYNACDKTFSITQYMSRRNFDFLGIRSDGVLYLGVNTDLFKVDNKKYKKKGEHLDIVFIGTDIRRKRLYEFLELANRFPFNRFHVIGGHRNEDIYKTLDYTPLPNVYVHGQLNHTKLSILLRKMDLHVFPSRSEGFPKVTLETAAAGVPSIVYGDYGASEWITTGKDGFVVDKFEEIVDIVRDLQNHPEKLTILSENAKMMASKFDWKTIVKSWENEIEKMYNS